MHGMPPADQCDGCNHIIPPTEFDKVIKCSCNICGGFVLCIACHIYFGTVRQERLLTLIPQHKEEQ